MPTEWARVTAAARRLAKRAGVAVTDVQQTGMEQLTVDLEKDGRRFQVRIGTVTLMRGEAAVISEVRRAIHELRVSAPAS